MLLSHRNGTYHRFISPLHGPAVRRQRPGRRFHPNRCRRSLRRPSRHHLPLDEDLQALLRRPPPPPPPAPAPILPPPAAMTSTISATALWNPSSPSSTIPRRRPPFC